MRMRGVAGDEDAAGLVCLGHRDAQVPKPHIVELAGEGKTRGFLQQPVKVIIVARRVGRDRRMKEPALADIDPAEELPIAAQIGMNDPVGGTWRETLELL